jgi:hypothetical protein
MHRMFTFWLCVTTLPLVAHADAEFSTPKVGSRDRREIMNALRTPVEAAYREKVKFSVRGLESNGTYALVFVEPLDKDGNVIASRKTKNGRGELLDLDGWVFAILKKEGKRWQILELDLLEQTDGLELWPQKYPAIPDHIFEGVGVATNAEG